MIPWTMAQLLSPGTGNFGMAMVDNQGVIYGQGCLGLGPMFHKFLCSDEVCWREFGSNRFVKSTTASLSMTAGWRPRMTDIYGLTIEQKEEMA